MSALWQVSVKYMCSYCIEQTADFFLQAETAKFSAAEEKSVFADSHRLLSSIVQPNYSIGQTIFDGVLYIEIYFKGAVHIISDATPWKPPGTVTCKQLKSL